MRWTDPRMDDEDNKPLMQTELLHDVVFDSSLPLRAPPRPTSSGKRRGFSPDYDPDTIDLFDQVIESGNTSTEDIGPMNPSPLAETLRTEITHDLGAILDELNHPEAD